MQSTFETLYEQHIQDAARMRTYEDEGNKSRPANEARPTLRHPNISSTDEVAALVTTLAAAEYSCWFDHRLRANEQSTNKRDT